MKQSHSQRGPAKSFANLRVATVEIEFSARKRFSYRHNPDGTIDAICMSCYLTAATASSPQELRRGESVHEEECLGKTYSDRVTSTHELPSEPTCSENLLRQIT